MHSHDEHRLIAVLERIACALEDANDLDKIEHLVQRSHNAIVQQLQETETRIMSAISDFKTKFDAFEGRLSTAIDGLTGDIQTLNDKITELQNSQGSISAEDQATLDEITALGEALATKAEALDALTPPKPPTP